METEKNAVGNTIEYQYNSELLIKQMTDSAGEKTTYTYDSLNRLKMVKDDWGTIEYTYDTNGNITQISEKEAGLSNLFTGKKVIRREFDTLNRVTKYTDYKGREVKYAYDPLGRMEALTYPGGEIVHYEYNNDGNVSKMTSNSGGIFTYEYDNYGRLCKIIRADGSTETWEYDPAGQLTKQTDLDKNGNVLQENHYTYNVFGEVIKKDIASNGDLSTLTSVKNAVRFLYNGSYGVATDENGLYYMRARYYNPDIKVGGIGSSQSLNRYAYCEGNPVNMVDPFGLCGENANDQGNKSKSGWLHTVLDITGLFFDGADILNVVIYAAEGEWVNAGICMASSLPVIGTAVNTKNIRYSQNDIRGTFDDGTKINDLTYHLKNSLEYASSIEPIRLVKYNDLPTEVQEYLSKQGVSSSTVFSLENRKLYVAKQAGVKVNSVWATQQDLKGINLLKRFLTVTGGKTMEVR